MRKEIMDAVENADLEEGEWPSPLFLFIKNLKSNPQFRKLDSEKAFEVVSETIDIEKTYAFSEDEDPKTKFLGIWEGMKFIIKKNALEIANEAAKKYPLSILEGDRISDQFCYFLSLAGWLFVMHEKEPFILSQRAVGGSMRCSHVTVNSYVHLAISRGYLTKTREHKFNEKTGEGRPAEYIFHFEKLPADALAKIEKHKSEIVGIEK